MGVIHIKGLGKAYKSYASQWSRLAEWLMPFEKPRHHRHWVLQDVELSVGEGESVGIVGSNGAGKSTLLKIITGIVRQSCGTVALEGRVAAMLELGMGFHPDFTGRQNVMMGGQLLGLSVSDIQKLMPEIEAFAEIGEYIDQPVRTYSSGMQMRLAFSVATAHRPDILIVDEALSVGDAYFQHKSFGRIRKFREAGTTLLIVSHDRYAIQTVCDRAILLDAGRIRMEGRPVEVLDFYNAMMAERDHQQIQRLTLADGNVATVSGTGEAHITGVRITDQHGQTLQSIEVGQLVRLEISIKARIDLDRVVLGFMITDRLGQCIYGINTHRLEQPIMNMTANEEATFWFDFPVRLGKGNYTVALSLSREDSHIDKNYEWRDSALMLHVFNTRQENFVGCNWLDAKVSIERRIPNQSKVHIPA